MPDEHKVLIITTGGTIEGEVASNVREDEAITGAEEFSQLLLPTITSMRNKTKNPVDIEIVHLPLTYNGEKIKVDSSDMLPVYWKEMADAIKKNFSEYNSFIISHGTNTMGYTCAALSFALANSGKPIIVTGSQVPAGMPGSDAETNLNNALRVATWKKKHGEEIRGVFAVFGSHIITGTRVKKDTEFDYDAFKSFSIGSIGRIGRIINIDETNLEKHVNYLSTSGYPEAEDSEDLRCKNDFDMRIASLTEFPGMSPDIFKTLVERNDIQGFVLRAFGAGDASTNLWPAFNYLKEEEIPIVVTTQAPNGNSNFQVNEPGEYLRKRKLAIPAYDMSIESQTTKLAWLLARKNNKDDDDITTYDQVCIEMVHDMRGEINVLWEVGK